jgi:epsilon-lactone hydrolase
MGSVRSQFFFFLLKHRHWFHLKLRKETIDLNTSIPKLRERVENSAGRFGRVHPEIEVSPLETKGFSAEWIRPIQTHNYRAILYFHGGGYVMGSSRSHRAIVSKFVAGSGISALVVNYRLAPEHPFPATP